MLHEPHEIRANFSRIEAIQRARQLVAANNCEEISGETRASSRTETIEQAFAELPEAPRREAPSTAAINEAMRGQLADQLRSLDAQRARLAALLEQAPN